MPLIVKAPGQSERRTDGDWISHVHLPELILGLCRSRSGSETLSDGFPTRSRELVVSENYYSRAADLRAPWGDRFDRVRF